MSVCKVCIVVVFVNFSHGAQLSAQVESQMFGHSANAVFDTIKDQIEGKDALPENADINRVLYGNQALAWDEISQAVLDSWRPAFSGSGITGSNSGSVVAISDTYILKSEDSSFYANFQKIKDSYLTRASNPNSCLQKIRGVYWTGSWGSYTYWFLIENSNKHAAGRNQFRFDMKASRQIGKDSGFTGAAGKLGFTDDFFYLKDLQSWTYTQPLTQQDGRNAVVRKAIQDDLQIFYDAWSRSVNPVQLIDFSILVFVNSIPVDDEDPSPSNCVRFTRVNPETGAEETLEMCFSIIDFFAHLSMRKKLGQKADQIKVYGRHNKFNKSYAPRLNQLMGDMLADTTTVHNIVRHYVPQARERFQRHAMDLAAQYRKTTPANRSWEAFADTYYESNPHGLPKVILQPLYKICAYGLSERVNQNLPKFIKNFNITSRDDQDIHTSKAQFVAHLWDLVEKKVASMGASGRLARLNTARMFTTKYEQLKPSNGKPVNKARGGAVKLNRQDVLNRNRAQLIR